ncbi:MAG: DNA-binding protein [Desulfobulbaceae bacterium]|nr:DNA-binding protein [Desulfobulbaceae bacterium]
MKRTIVCIMCYTVITTLLLSAAVHLQAATSTPESDTSITGTVLETMSGAGYTYVQLDTTNGQVWVALPESTVTVGESLALQPGLVMNDFHSKTFDRTFSAIVFSPGRVSGEAAPAAAPDQAQPAPSAADDPFAAAVAAERGSPQPQTAIPQSGGSTAAIAPFAEVEVAKASGENGYRVGEVFAKAQQLDGTTVRVRGTVVKYNANIMGRNWVHLQDGSGDPLNNTHDLVVTTSQELTKDQVVTLEGTVAINRDFGAGYTYGVLVEQAVVVDER